MIVDHKPLLPIFNSQAIPHIENVRCQNYRARLQMYNFEVVWKKGADHSIPDALSRAPIDPPDSDEDPAQPRTMASLAFQGEGPVDKVMEKLKDQAKEDRDYQCLLKALQDGSFERRKEPYLKQFRPVHHLLSTDDGLVYKDNQVVIPPCAVQDVLKELHRSHQGVEKTKRRARETVFWPNYSIHIAEMIQSCERCQEFHPSNKTSAQH